MAATAAASKRSARIAVVTGGNRGIGYECCRLLASEKDVDCILTARTAEKGREAVAALQADGARNVRWLATLDISDEASIEAFAQALEKDAGRLDILLNNAGIMFRDTFNADCAAATIKTNVTGTVLLTDRLLPMLRKSPSGRIVNVASQIAVYAPLSKAVKAEVTAKTATRETIAEVGSRFVKAVAAGNVKAAGFPDNMYGTSKSLEIAVTEIIAREEGESKGLEVNSCCPGWCQTDMGGARANRTAAAGAVTPVWLALRKPGGGSGQFWFDKKVIRW